MQLSSFRQLIPLSGTATVTPAAVGGGSAVGCNEILVQNQSDVITLLVGASSAQPIQILPGQSATFRVNNTSLLYVSTASGSAAWGALAGVY
jgi:hypothetical protein